MSVGIMALWVGDRIDGIDLGLTGLTEALGGGFFPLAGGVVTDGEHEPLDFLAAGEFGDGALEAGLGDGVGVGFGEVVFVEFPAEVVKRDSEGFGVFGEGFIEGASGLTGEGEACGLEAGEVVVLGLADLDACGFEGVVMAEVFFRHAGDVLTAEAKPGFFTRIFTKMDSAMKTKADEAAKNQCCSPNDKGKGGKCC